MGELVLNKMETLKRQNYNRVLASQILGVLVFQLLQKVPNTALVAMTTTTTMDCRDVYWPKQWLWEVST